MDTVRGSAAKPRAHGWVAVVTVLLVVVSGLLSSTAAAAPAAPPASRQGSLSLPSSAVAGTTVRVVAAFTPARRGAAVKIQQARGNGWRTVVSGKQNAAGKMARNVTAPRAGQWRYRAVTRAGSTKEHAVTPVRTLRSDPGPDPAVQGRETLSVASDNACAIQTDMTLWCWGYRQLADETAGDQLTDPRPVQVPGRWKTVSQGTGHTCGLQLDDTAWCWGGNDLFGPLGDGTTQSRATAVPVAGGGTWRSISAGSFHTCGVQTDGRAYCWGNDRSLQLGRVPEEGDLDHEVVPTPVAGDARWASVVAGAIHSCGIQVDGSAWCWGSNVVGTLGSGDDADDAGRPVEVAGAATWRSLALGGAHTCGVQTDGSGWCWGWDHYGELGNDLPRTDARTPTRIAGGGRWTTVSAGGYTTCGIRPGGAASCWGDARFGGLGSGATGADFVATPRAVSGGHAFSEVEQGPLATCGIRTDGVGLCWGSNDYSVLGDGTTRSTTTPVRIADDHVWAH